MRLEVFAAQYERLVIKVGQELKLAQVIEAQVAAEKAAKHARQLLEEMKKESKE